MALLSFSVFPPIVQHITEPSPPAVYNVDRVLEKAIDVTPPVNTA